MHSLVAMVCGRLRESYAPINTRPHYPHTAPWGLVGIILNMHMNFDPSGGAFDLNTTHTWRWHKWLLSPFWLLSGIKLVVLLLM
jgi:hypothetical protein